MDSFMLYNKKTIPTALTITGGFTILKTQRRLTTEKYATIGGSMVHILICDDDAAFAQDMAKKIQALPAYSPKSMNVQLLTDVTAMSAGVLTKFDILFWILIWEIKTVSNWHGLCGNITLRLS